MPCVSLKHRGIYREQILPCILTRINTEKAAKANKNNQNISENPQIINQNPTNLSNQPVSATVEAPVPATMAQTQATAQIPTNSTPAPTSTFPVQPARKADFSKPKLMVEGQEISLRHAEPTPPASSPALSNLEQLNSELATITSTQPTAISSRDIPRPNGLRARFRTAPRPTREDLINAESRLGGSIFGPIPEGHRREFFHDQRNVWIWYEGWYDDSSDYHNVTVRYEVYPSGVYKKISAGNYQRLEDGELDNFRQATRTYLQLIKQNLYRLN